MGRCAVVYCPTQRWDYDCIKGMGVRGAMDALGKNTQLCGTMGDRAHQRGFSRARAAFDDVHLPALRGAVGLLEQRAKAGRSVGSKEIIGIKFIWHVMDSPRYLILPPETRQR